MATCAHCGAPIALSQARPTDCKFCGATNAPAPAPRQEPQPVQIVQIVEASDTAPAVGRCPHCLRVLVSVKVGEVELLGCPGCGGIWLANTSAKSVLENPQQVFHDLAMRAARNATGDQPRNPRPACPVCSVILARTWFHDVNLDLCAEHGTWFDARELGALVTSVREAKRAVERENSGGSVTCVACRGTVLRTRTHMTISGTVCDDCYRESQRQEAARTAEATPSGSVLMDLHQALYTTR